MPKIEKLSHSRIYAFLVPTRFIKFGHSNAPVRRLREVQCACPFALELYSLSLPMSRTQAILAESKIHASLAEYHARLEWFNVAPKTMAFANLMKKSSYEEICTIVDGWISNEAFIKTETQLRQVIKPAKLIGNDKTIRNRITSFKET